ncbi:MAG: hypothetical protein HY013_19905 [Candidatus Solibacter usitatus]|nr:hypothetical protein [Candidatus Solibacter usitatus]
MVRVPWVFGRLLLLLPLGMPALAAHPCAACHRKQVEGYLRTGMGQSLTRDATQPSGRFFHGKSGSTATITSSTLGMRQRIERAGLAAEYAAAYVIGSGHKAFGYLVEIGGFLYQSPFAYYSERGMWDVAPGYEANATLDFNRPVTIECLLCHSGQPRPVAGTLNRYEPPPFAVEAISCDRCHGPVETHLAHPSAASIVNPRRLPPRARDSVCEQCHLGGEARILNPGKKWQDFAPGQELEDTFTVFVQEFPKNAEGRRAFTVVSHVEQLARSVCWRRSAGKLWCGSCHDPHETPANARRHYRERCLSCHAATLAASHRAESADCTGCHMQARQAVDGSHAAFTDHEIARRPARVPAIRQIRGLSAWRPAPAAFSLRNLALAYLSVGERDRSSYHLNEAFRLMAEARKEFPRDPDLAAGLGLILLLKDLPREAARAFELSLALRPRHPRSYQNLAAAWSAAGEPGKAIAALEAAIELDPSLDVAYYTLADIYEKQNDAAGRRRALERYLRIRPQSLETRRIISLLPSPQ